MENEVEMTIYIDTYKEKTVNVTKTFKNCEIMFNRSN